MILDALIGNNISLKMATVYIVEIGLLGGWSKWEGKKRPGISLREQCKIILLRRKDRKIQ